MLALSQIAVEPYGFETWVNVTNLKLQLVLCLLLVVHVVLCAELSYCSITCQLNLMNGFTKLGSHLTSSHPIELDGVLFTKGRDIERLRGLSPHNFRVGALYKEMGNGFFYKVTNKTSKTLLMLRGEFINKRSCWKDVFKDFPDEELESIF